MVCEHLVCLMERTLKCWKAFRSIWVESVTRTKWNCNDKQQPRTAIFLFQEININWPFLFPLLRPVLLLCLFLAAVQTVGLNGGIQTAKLWMNCSENRKANPEYERASLRHQLRLSTSNNTEIPEESLKLGGHTRNPALISWQMLARTDANRCGSRKLCLFRCQCLSV